MSADHEERRRKNMACGHWVPDLHLVKVVQLKGNFWKNHGFSFESSDYLYPEEAMFLHERQQIYVQMGETVLDKRSLYELVLSSMPHACYLTYLKLKTLEYICLRHTRELRCFTVVQDVYGTTFYCFVNLMCTSNHSFVTSYVCVLLQITWFNIQRALYWTVWYPSRCTRMTARYSSEIYQKQCPLRTWSSCTYLT